MWRSMAVACAAAIVAFPLTARATPPGYTSVGPPQALGTVVFGANGSEYGATGFVSPTTDGNLQLSDTAAGYPGLDPAIWRSTDHGRTWSAIHHAPSGSQIAVRAVSPADPAIVFADMTIPSQAAPYVVARIDARTGVATPLPFTHWIGADATGTAYGLTQVAGSNGWTLARCPAAAACEQLPLPPVVGPCIAVDTLSQGVLASTGYTSMRVSTDGGTTWTVGAPIADRTCAIAFAGPAPRTLYTLLYDQLMVSHDAGLTATPRTVAREMGYVLGSHPSASIHISEGAPVQLSSDEGATLRPLSAPLPTRVVVTDPADPAHLVVSAFDQTEQTPDGGATWSEIRDPRFGMVVLPSYSTAGSSSRLYAWTAYSAWVSADRGATWQESRPATFFRPESLLVARSDPRTAYVQSGGKELRTRDGGATWERIALPDFSSVTWLPPGDPAHLVTTPGYGGGTAVFESRDAGTTWTPVAASDVCSFKVVVDPASPTGQRLGCEGWTSYDPQRPPASTPLPRAEGPVSSPDAPGAYALVDGFLLGDVRPDWSWDAATGLTGIYGPTPRYALAAGAWPTPAGTVFYAYDIAKRVTWVRRGSGRWWRLQEAGRDLAVISVLDASHAYVRVVNHDPDYDSFPAEPLGVVDLAQPTVAPPHVDARANGLTCSVPWSPADATAEGFTWRRDGVVLQGATGMRRATSKLDRGHLIGCSVTAATAFGSARIASAPAYRAPGARIAPPRPRLVGLPRVGSRLRCSARTHVSWFRGTRPATRMHTQTYLLQARDAGHRIACQTRLADGTVTRSPALLVRS